MALRAPDVTKGAATPQGVTCVEGVVYASRRALELWTAAVAALLGVIVSAESLTHDIGWNEAGPGSGYLGWMMRRHGGHGWLMSAVYGAAVMAAFFLIVDVWFRVPLARGPW